MFFINRFDEYLNEVLLENIWFNRKLVIFFNNNIKGYPYSNKVAKKGSD